MAKNVISNPAFQTKESSQNPIGFNLVTKVNSFTSIFDLKPLDQEEEDQIKNLLLENFNLSDLKEEKEKINADFHKLKNITAEIKAIQKQGLILIGERLEKARDVLKSYKDGTFTKWLKDTFKSKQTGYNILSYYGLYKSLPTLELKEIFKKMPQKAAYVLANRDGDTEKKIEIIKEHHADKPTSFIKLVQEAFPLEAQDQRKRKEKDAVLIENIRINLRLLLKRKDELTEESLRKISELRDLIDEIIG